MRVNQVIEKLTAIRNEHGNVQVAMAEGPSISPEAPRRLPTVSIVEYGNRDWDDYGDWVCKIIIC